MAEEKKNSAWWKELLVGLVMLAVTGYLYWEFYSFENAAESTRKMSKVLAVIYDSVGKNLTCGALGSIGIVLTLVGIINFIKSNKKVKVIPHKTHPNFSFNQE